MGIISIRISTANILNILREEVSKSEACVRNYVVYSTHYMPCDTERKTTNMHFILLNVDVVSLPENVA